MIRSGKKSRARKQTPKKSPAPPLFNCSFCNKSQADVKQLVAGPDGVYICDECIDLCGEIIRNARGPSFKVIRRGTCDFCGGEKFEDNDYLIVSHTGTICRECCGRLFMFWPKHELDQLRREGVDVDRWERDPAESAPIVEAKKSPSRRLKGKQ